MRKGAFKDKITDGRICNLNLAYGLYNPEVCNFITFNLWIVESISQIRLTDSTIWKY